MSLTLTSAAGRVFFLNGRGSYSELGKVTLTDALASFDRYAACVAAGNGGPADDVSPETQATITEAYNKALKVAAELVRCHGAGSEQH